MERTQIYLDEDQKAALRALAADRGQNVSDVIRQAIDRYLREDFGSTDLPTRLASIQARILAQIGDVSDQEIDAAAKRARARVRRKHPTRA
jgi:Arc/MetJ-type ribon-helix-helix transcriptional regulator